MGIKVKICMNVQMKTNTERVRWKEIIKIV